MADFGLACHQDHGVGAMAADGAGLRITSGKEETPRDSRAQANGVILQVQVFISS